MELVRRSDGCHPVTATCCSGQRANTSVHRGGCGEKSDCFHRWKERCRTPSTTSHQNIKIPSAWYVPMFIRIHQFTTTTRFLWSVLVESDFKTPKRHCPNRHYCDTHWLNLYPRVRRSNIFNNLWPCFRLLVFVWIVPATAVKVPIGCLKNKFISWPSCHN